MPRNPYEPLTNRPQGVTPGDRNRVPNAGRKGKPGNRPGMPGRLIEGQRTYGWREALNELAIAYPGRIR
jgi:putative transposase